MEELLLAALSVLCSECCTCSSKNAMCYSFNYPFFLKIHSKITLNHMSKDRSSANIWISKDSGFTIILATPVLRRQRI